MPPSTRRRARKAAQASRSLLPAVRACAAETSLPQASSSSVLRKASPTVYLNPAPASAESGSTSSTRQMRGKASSSSQTKRDDNAIARQRTAVDDGAIESDADAMSRAVTVQATATSSKGVSGVQRPLSKRRARAASSAGAPQIRAAARASLSRLSTRALASHAPSARAIVALCASAVEALGGGARPSNIADVARYAAEAFEADASSRAELAAVYREIDALKKKLAKAETNAKRLQARAEGASAVSACVMRTALSYMPRVQSSLNPRRVSRRDRRARNRQAEEDVNALVSNAFAGSDRDAENVIAGSDAPEPSTAAGLAALTSEYSDYETSGLQNVDVSVHQDLVDNQGDPSNHSSVSRANPGRSVATSNANAQERRNDSPLNPQSAVLAIRSALRSITSSRRLLSGPEDERDRSTFPVSHLVPEEQSSDEEVR